MMSLVSYKRGSSSNEKYFSCCSRLLSLLLLFPNVINYQSTSTSSIGTVNAFSFSSSGIDVSLRPSIYNKNGNYDYDYDNGGGGDGSVRIVRRSSSSLFAYNKRRELVTVSDLVKEVTQDSDKLESLLSGRKKKNNRKRTRQRVSEPKQQYQYASQKNQEKERNNEEIMKWWRQVASSSTPAKQHSDWIISDVPGEGIPIFVQTIRLINDDDDTTSSSSDSFAHILYKPPGWSILNEKKKNNKKESSNININIKTNIKNNIKNSQGALSIPNKYIIAKSNDNSNSKKATNKKNNKKNEKVKYYNDDNDSYDYLEYNPNEIWDVLTPEERAGFDFEEWQSSLDDDGAKKAKRDFNKEEHEEEEEEEEVEQVKEEQISSASRVIVVDQNGPANILSTQQRPSLISWFKSDMMESQGIQVRGGNHWKAIAGAVDIDDSGLVLIVPRKKIKTKQISSFLVQSMTYLAVVGNGQNLQSVQKKQLFANSHEIHTLAKLRKGREKDEVQVAQVKLYAGDSIDTTNGSTCDDIIGICQDNFKDGIRGDAMAHPLDRRASRRLLHCHEMELIITTTEDEGDRQTQEQMLTIRDPLMDNNEDNMPPDISIYANRQHSHGFTKAGGDFLGRQTLQQNSLTNAYREINGEGDGLPGWIVDRYDQWLFVQEQQQPQGQQQSLNNRGGPLSSIHANHTAGVYHVSTLADRSVQSNTKPKWIQGQKLPIDSIVKVKENNITYHVKLGQDWSTGIFLDQRPTRAWLSQHCTNETRVLNCFAHCGAFSVAAATAGAKTVSLDLESKWLDRIQPQLDDNQIANDNKQHDFIYGDCFDWLNRLAKRGEKFDIVILDPPSTSVSTKKNKQRRWSVKKDMDELVRLAASLVKTPGGLLFTTTNSASISPFKFAKSCQNGLSDTTFQLERVIPMSHDFPSVGPSPVKNLVWRILK